jgi:ribosomal protein S27AE
MYDSDDEIEETLAECPKCGASIYDDVEQCPRCGEWITGTELSGGGDGHGKRTFVVVVALVLLGPILFRWIF